VVHRYTYRKIRSSLYIKATGSRSRSRSQQKQNYVSVYLARQCYYFSSCDSVRLCLL